MSSIPRLLPLTLLAAMLSTQALGQIVTVKGLPEHGLNLIAPNTPEFTSTLPRLITAEQQSIVDPLLPFSVILVNNSNQAVIAHTLRWVCTALDGRRTHRTTTRGGDMFTFKGPKLAPHFSILWTPVCTGIDISPRRSRSIQKAADRFRLQQEIAVALDGVLFEDGKFVGPNESGIRDQHEGLLAASEEIKSIFLTKEKQGEPPDAIFGWLKSIENYRPRRPGKASAIEWYQFWRSRLAGRVLRRRASSGDATALEMIGNLKVIQISTGES